MLDQPFVCFMSDFMLNQPSMGGWEYPGFPLQILSHNCGHFSKAARQKSGWEDLSMRQQPLLRGEHDCTLLRGEYDGFVNYVAQKRYILV